MLNIKKERLILIKDIIKDVLEIDTEKQPSLIYFKNTEKALKILKKHIDLKNKIAIHADVDMDGIGSTFILNRFLLRTGLNGRIINLINKEKLHGIQPEQIDKLNHIGMGLLIILDSSTNEIDLIKELYSDVIIIDHHEVLHNELSGETKNGEYVIINNLINNLDTGYQTEDKMSCGLVLYEFLRTFQETFKTSNILEDDMLYQWVGVTLFSDSIRLKTQRNQYYINKTINTYEIGPSLKTIMFNINSYQKTLDKRFINFSFTPLINKSIRAGKPDTALDIILNRPKDIIELKEFNTLQEEALKTAEEKIKITDTCVLGNLTDTNINKSYCGVIATKFRGQEKKNTAIYKVTNGTAIGSFRGRKSDIDYRRYFESYSDDIYAQGHKAAFGFRVPEVELENIMQNLTKIEKNIETKPKITAGDIPKSLQGEYHIKDMQEFIKNGGLYELALYNSRVSYEETYNIITTSTNAELKEQWERVSIYEILGLDCVTFKKITSDLIELMPEINNGRLKIYAQNK